MAICKDCGKEYDISEDKDKFNSIYSMDIDNIIQDYCFDCASSEIEAQGDYRDCDNCGKRFYFNDADDDFMSEHGISLNDGFNECLCLKCANSAVEDREYYKECDNCGTRFHVGEADSKFENECGEYHLENGSRSDYGDGWLCADCALDKVREDYERLLESGFFDN